MDVYRTTETVERQAKATADFARRLRALKGQDWYCKGCANYGACRTVLSNGDECDSRAVGSN